MIKRVWRRLKRWRTIRLGPVALLFKVQRAVQVSAMSRRRLRAARERHEAWAQSQLNKGAPNVQGKAVREVALIVGVGPGLGYAMAWRFAQAGMAVVLASRDAERLDRLVEAIGEAGGTAFAYGCDATSESSVDGLMRAVVTNHGVPHLVAYSLQHFGPGQVVDVELCAFEDAWKHNCLGAFLVARGAAREMLPHGRGTIVLIGSTSSLIGRAGHLNLSVGKFGQRALAQVLARELWPRGIHATHIVIDADIYEGEPRDDGGPQSQPADIADLVLTVHHQPRSAWTSEVDVRPSDERFWEHC
jgi:NAD(P)-dependent dehydrogenase (short-subunit alcohol dehydrogenase family)